MSADGSEYKVGTNVGILASQSLGERSTQLTMKAFHKGGIVESTGGARAYGILEELNVKPRTKYLARIVNPGPETE